MSQMCLRTGVTACVNRCNAGGLACHLRTYAARIPGRDHSQSSQLQRAAAEADWRGFCLGALEGLGACLVLRTAAPKSGPVSKVSRRQILGMKTRAPTRIVGHARGRPSWGLFFSAWQFHATFTESCKNFQTSSEKGKRTFAGHALDDLDCWARLRLKHCKRTLESKCFCG